MLSDHKSAKGESMPENDKHEGSVPNQDQGSNESVSEGTEAVADSLSIEGSAEQVSVSANNNKVFLSAKLKKILLVTAAVSTVLLIVAGVFLLVFYIQIQDTLRVVLYESTYSSDTDDLYLYDEETFESDTTVDGEDSVLDQIHTAFPENIVNIGLLGFDRGWDRESRGHYMFRPDVQALISIDFELDRISVIRIPRDSYVPIHNAGGFHDKINHAYQYGYYSGGSEDRHADGVRYTLLTISDVLGEIPIHYYVSVDMYSVIALVDALGGIYYDVEEEIVDIVWIFGVLLPPIPAGPQVLDGTDYMRYLQYRDAQSGQDRGRIVRQGELLKATYQYLRENGRLSDIPVIFKIYRDYVDTDLCYKKISALANYYLKTEPADENLQFYILGGSSQTRDGIYYQVISQEQRRDIVKEVFGLTIKPWPPIVLKDSPEYIQEQERKNRLEEGSILGPHFPVIDNNRLFDDKNINIY